jgi:hypothetical protein
MSDLYGLDEEMQEDKVVSMEDGREAVKAKRKPFHYWEVGGKEYKLKLTTQMIGKLETKYRTNILTLVSDNGIPPLSVMLTVIQAAISPWEHGVSFQDVQKIYDQWLEGGGNQMELFSNIIMPTMAVSGFFTQKQAESMMESLKSVDELL